MFRHIIYAISFWQLVISIIFFFILVVKISSKQSLWKNGKQLNLGTGLCWCLTETPALRLVGTVFDSKVVSLRRMKKKNLKILQIISKQNPPFFVYHLLTFELSNMSWKCLENCNMLTERTYDSAAFKFLLNIITICVFIAQ